MARTLALLVLAIVASSVLVQTTTARTTHVVGDSLGWVVPPGGPIVYATWAVSHTFLVGDILCKHTGTCLSLYVICVSTCFRFWILQNSECQKLWQFLNFCFIQNCSKQVGGFCIGKNCLKQGRWFCMANLQFFLFASLLLYS